MDLLEFINKYFGVANVGDTDANKGQCVGLIEVWADTYNTAHDWGNAKDLLANADPNSFDIVQNDPTNLNQFPPAGAIMVWGETWGGGEGHTGVVVAANGTSFACFEQNNPTGSAPIINYHPNYSGVLGWLIIKLYQSPQQIEDSLRAARDSDWNLYQKQLAATQALQQAFDDYRSAHPDNPIVAPSTPPVQVPTGDTQPQTPPIEADPSTNSSFPTFTAIIKNILAIFGIK